MAITSLLEVDIRSLLENIERIASVRLPRRVIEVSLNNNVLHIRFTYPRTRESEVEPLPLRTPVMLFRDEESGEIIALEILDVEKLLEELGEHSTKT